MKLSHLDLLLTMVRWPDGGLAQKRGKESEVRGGVALRRPLTAPEP